MFKINFDLQDFKKHFLFKKAVLLKNSFETSPCYVRDFYKILLTPMNSFYEPLVKIVHNNKFLDTSIWSHKVNETKQCIDINAVKKAIELKCSVVFNKYYQYCDYVRELIIFIENAFNCFSSCNAYLSQNGGKCFQPHTDSHHVMVFSISGKKEWTLYNEKKSPIDAYHAIAPKIDTDSIIDSGIDLKCIMEPGDILYIPLGQFHSVSNLEDNSLHFTVGLNFPPLYYLIESALQEFINSSQNQSLSPKIHEALNEIHPAYAGASIDKDKIAEKLDLLLSCIKEVASQESFVARHVTRNTNHNLRLTTPASDDLIDDLAKCYL